MITHQHQPVPFFPPCEKVTKKHFGAFAAAGNGNFSCIFMKALIYCLSLLITLSVLADSYDENPTSIEAKAAFMAGDYQKAKKLVQELLKNEDYKARALLSLAAIAGAERDFSSAEQYAWQAYQLGLESGLNTYVLLLAQQEKAELLMENLEYILTWSLRDVYVLHALMWVALTQENIPYDRVLLALRHTPLELLTQDSNTVRFLLTYGNDEDSILASYIYQKLPNNQKNLENRYKAKLLPFPDIAAIEKARKKLMADSIFHEYRIAIKAGNKEKAWELILQLNKSNEFKPALLPEIAHMLALRGDYMRSQQLAMVAYGLGQKYALPILLTAMIMRRDAIVLNYEKDLFEYSEEDRLDLKSDLIVQYCLLTNNKEAFLNWIHSNPSELLPATEGVKKSLLKALEKWGGDKEKTILETIRTSRPPSPSVINWPDFDQYPLRYGYEWGKPFSATNR